MRPVFINCTAETFTPTKSGAISTWLWETCRVAQTQGVEPWVITRTSAAPPYAWANTVFVDYPHIPRNRILSKAWYLHRDLTGWGHVRQKAYVLRVVQAIRRAGLQDGPFILHNDIEMAVYLRRQFPKAFLLHHAHNANPCSPKFRAQFGQSVDTATAVSDYCSKWNADYFSMGEGSVKTIYNGVDLERFTPAQHPAGTPVINFVGRTDQAKAPDLLLKAAQQLSEKTTQFRLQILGSNHYGYSVPDAYQTEMAELSADLERRGIAVSRPGFISRADLPEALRRAQINVVPSRWEEPFALVLAEGMASGLATIASRTGGMPEVLGSAGLLFERDSVDGLAAHLETLVLDETCRAEYAQAARCRAQEFPWERTWNEMKSLVRD
ncbi:MAG: glycosyltransferase family 4 protein [Janthinobacterium lividum]